MHVLQVDFWIGWRNDRSKSQVCLLHMNSPLSFVFVYRRGFATINRDVQGVRVIAERTRLMIQVTIRS